MFIYYNINFYLLSLYFSVVSRDTHSTMSTVPVFVISLLIAVSAIDGMVNNPFYFLNCFTVEHSLRVAKF